MGQYRENILRREMLPPQEARPIVREDSPPLKPISTVAQTVDKENVKENTKECLKEESIVL